MLELPLIHSYSDSDLQESKNDYPRAGNESIELRN